MASENPFAAYGVEPATRTIDEPRGPTTAKPQSSEIEHEVAALIEKSARSYLAGKPIREVIRAKVVE